MSVWKKATSVELKVLAELDYRKVSSHFVLFLLKVKKPLNQWAKHALDSHISIIYFFRIKQIGRVKSVQYK